MLRISVTTTPDGTTITLEGALSGAWVSELGDCWRRLRSTAARPVQLRLDGVTFIDDGGKAVLRALYADGVALSATSVVMRPLAESIAAGYNPRTIRPTR